MRSIVDLLIVALCLTATVAWGVTPGARPASAMRPPSSSVDRRPRRTSGDGSSKAERRDAHGAPPANRFVPRTPYRSAREVGRPARMAACPQADWTGICTGTDNGALPSRATARNPDTPPRRQPKADARGAIGNDNQSSPRAINPAATNSTPARPSNSLRATRPRPRSKHTQIQNYSGATRCTLTRLAPGQLGARTDVAIAAQRGSNAAANVASNTRGTLEQVRECMATVPGLTGSCEVKPGNVKGAAAVVGNERVTTREVKITCHNGTDAVHTAVHFLKPPHRLAVLSSTGDLSIALGRPGVGVHTPVPPDTFGSRPLYATVTPFNPPSLLDTRTPEDLLRSYVHHKIMDDLEMAQGDGERGRRTQQTPPPGSPAGRGALHDEEEWRASSGRLPAARSWQR